MAIDTGMQDIFNKWFKYKDGKLYWKIRPLTNGINIGDRAGNINSSGYRSVKLLGITYREHRIIWIMHYGDIPEHLVVDHENRVRDLNLIENLRLVTPQQNRQNSEQQDNAKSKFYGVHINNNKWYAQICKPYKETYLGKYDEEIDAARAVNIYCKENKIDIFNDVIEPFKSPQRNTKKSANFQSTQKGVIWNSNRCKWQVYINRKGYGSFSLEWEAIAKAKEVIANLGI